MFGVDTVLPPSFLLKMVVYCNMLELYVVPKSADIDVEKGLAYFKEDINSTTAYKSGKHSIIDSSTCRLKGQGLLLSLLEVYTYITSLEFLFWRYVTTSFKKIPNVDLLRQR